MMGRRIIRIAPIVLRDMFTTGNVFDNVIIRTGLPPGARFLRAWYDASLPGDGQIVLLFEHESWAEGPEGAQYETVDIVMQRETM